MADQTDVEVDARATDATDVGDASTDTAYPDQVPTGPDLRRHSSGRSITELCAELWHLSIRRALDPELPPFCFGRYEVSEVLGSGGFGAVFLGWDPKLERKVAIKLCARDPRMDAAILRAEAQALAKLSHPNIVTIYDVDLDEEGQRLFLVMEHVDGGTLYEHVPDTLRELVEIFAEVAKGVAEAHREGVVHGDIKPHNILLHKDLRPRLADFGVARIVGKETLMPDAIGTLPYTAPEILAGQIRDERSDQWSVGVSLCDCIDGKLPIIDTNARNVPSSEAKMLRAIQDWAGPSTLHTPIPDGLAEVLRIALSFDPRDRFPSMVAFADALYGVLASMVERMDRQQVEPQQGLEHQQHALADAHGPGQGRRDPERDQPEHEEDGGGAGDRDQSHAGPRADLAGDLAGVRTALAAMVEPAAEVAVAKPSPEPVVAEGAVVERDEPADHSWKKSGITALVLTTGLVLVGQAYLLGKHEARAESARHERRASIDSADRSSLEKNISCVADGVPMEPDASVRAMCRVLGTDGMRASISLWDEVTDSRELNARTTQDWLKLACDTTILAQTFLYEAGIADSERAKTLSEGADQLARAAEYYLSKATGKETAEAVSQVRSLVAALTVD